MDWPSRLRRAGITLLHIDVVKQGVKWSVLVLLPLLLLSHSSISGTACSPLPCKTNMRCSRCVEINRQGPDEQFLICVAMGRKIRETAQWSKDAWWCCVCREEGYLHASIDYRRGREHLPPAITGSRFTGGDGCDDTLEMYLWQVVFIGICLRIILIVQQNPKTSDAAVPLGSCGSNARCLCFA